MSEFGTQYNGLQGFAYSATAIINALAELNNTLSSLSIGNPLETVYLDPVGSVIQNISSEPQNYYLNNWTNCLKSVGFILQVKDTNTSNVLLNGVIELKPGTTFVLTVEQNRHFDLNSVYITVQPGDSVALSPICVS